MKYFLVTLLLFGMTANASIMDMAFGKQPVTKINPPEDGDHCVDYTGKWVGTCSVSGATEDGTIEITQWGCNAWYFDTAPDFIYLNGKKVITDTDLSRAEGPYSRDQIFDTKWDGDNIIMTITQKNSASPQPVLSSTGKFSLTGDGNTSLSIEWNNSNNEHKVCSLKKK